MKKLAIVTTHPIQYYAPVFRLLAASGQVGVKVFYTWGEASIDKYDPDFGKKVSWDIPLLEGYKYEFLTNMAKKPGSHHFFGIKNPDGIQKIEAFQPDAILVYGWAYRSHLQIMRYFKGKIPLWFRGDSTLLDKQQGGKSLFRNLFLRWVYRHVDQAFYVGSANKAYFSAYGLKENQLIFSPHAVDNSRFAEERLTEANALREELGIKQEDILILFAGKFEPKKDPELLLDAFIALNRPNVHLLFVGNGILEEKLKRKTETIQQFNNSTGKQYSNIHFLPFQNQSRMPVMYQACDLFCLSSHSETWGLAVNEAMAAGKAILVSDRVGCVFDLVKPGINGDIFKSGNQPELLLKLKTLCGSKRALEQQGLKSVEIIAAWSFNEQIKVIKKELLNL